MSSSPKQIQFFATVTSPWSYFASYRLAQLAETMEIAVDLVIIPTLPGTGWQPYATKSPAKQAYVRADLARWSRRLGVALNFAGRPDLSDIEGPSRMIIACALASTRALDLLQALQRHYWELGLDIGRPANRIAAAESIGLGGDALFNREHDAAVTEAWRANRQKALDQAVFGVPTFFYQGEIYWGQDRIDFLEAHLRQGHPI